MNIVKLFFTDESAATTMEYGLVAAGLSLAIITLLQGIGMRLSSHSPAMTGTPRQP